MMYEVKSVYLSSQNTWRTHHTEMMAALTTRISHAFGMLLHLFMLVIVQIIKSLGRHSRLEQSKLSSSAKLEMYVTSEI